MNRRHFLTATATLGVGAALPVTRAFSAPNDSNPPDVKGLPAEKSKLTPPVDGRILVALVISEGVNVIDFSGPWGVFSSVMLGGGTDHAMHRVPFDLITVSDKTEIVTSGGLKIVPNHTFADVPPASVVVIPAQQGSDAMIEWLRKVAPATDVTMSVCTGAFKLAKAGLLSGKAATTHHDYLDKLQKEYPDIQVKRGVRFVEGEKISTAGGLTSGTDLALRVVERYFGRDVAQTTATYMEYQGKGWIV
jgi:transcriptional regulator GlxA family with amidase domain